MLLQLPKQQHSTAAAALLPQLPKQQCHAAWLPKQQHCADKAGPPHCCSYQSWCTAAAAEAAAPCCCSCQSSSAVLLWLPKWQHYAAEWEHHAAVATEVAVSCCHGCQRWSTALLQLPKWQRHAATAAGAAVLCCHSCRSTSSVLPKWEHCAAAATKVAAMLPWLSMLEHCAAAAVKAAALHCCGCQSRSTALLRRPQQHNAAAWLLKQQYCAAEVGALCCQSRSTHAAVATEVAVPCCFTTMAVKVGALNC